MKKLPILILFKGAGGDADWIMPILYKLSNKYDIYSYFRSHQAYQSIKNNNEIFHFWKKTNKGFFIDSIYSRFFWKLLKKFFFSCSLRKKNIIFFNKKIHNITFLKKKFFGKNFNKDFKFVFSELNYPNGWIDSVLEKEDKTLIVHYPHSPYIFSLKKKIKSNYKLLGDLLLISSKRDTNMWTDFIDIKKIYSLGIPKYEKKWVERIANLNKIKIPIKKKFIVTIPYKSFFDIYPENRRELETQFHWILKTLLSIPEVIVIYKIHPRINSAHFYTLLEKYNDEFKKRIIVTNSHLFSLARISRLFVCPTNTSTILDSIIFKVPTIQFEPAFKDLDKNENFNNFYEKNKISIIFKDENELRKIISDIKLKKNKKKWLLQYRKFIEIHYTLNSVKKIVSFLEKKYRHKYKNR